MNGDVAFIKRPQSCAASWEGSSVMAMRARRSASVSVRNASLSNGGNQSYAVVDIIQQQVQTEIGGVSGRGTKANTPAFQTLPRVRVMPATAGNPAAAHRDDPGRANCPLPPQVSGSLVTFRAEVVRPEREPACGGPDPE
jgi:hypothetical protein